MSRSIFELIKERVVILDGGLGTELIRHGLPGGVCPESWNLERPEVVKGIHTSYFNAGSDVVSTNSFGANRIKLAPYGLQGKCYAFNLKAAQLAAEVRPEGKFVAGSMGPTGQLLRPQGELGEEEVEAAYAEQAGALSAGGVDFLLIETQYDIREALLAFRGARKCSDLPIFVTMTFNRNPEGYVTIMGNRVSQCIEELEAQGVCATGANCTLDISDMVDLVKVMRESTSLPLIVQANAGQPSLSYNGEVRYSRDVEGYVRFVPSLIRNGAHLIGGCCGTNPEYIGRIADVIGDGKTCSAF